MSHDITSNWTQEEYEAAYRRILDLVGPNVSDKDEKELEYLVALTARYEFKQTEQDYDPFDYDQDLDGDG